MRKINLKGKDAEHWSRIVAAGDAGLPIDEIPGGLRSRLYGAGMIGYGGGIGAETYKRLYANVGPEVKVFCYPCYEAHRERVRATKLAPQTNDPEGTWHWLPICDAHAEGWWDDEIPDHDIPGPIMPIEVVIPPPKKVKA